MDESKSLKGLLEHYLRLPIWLNLFWVAVVAAMCYYNLKWGVITGVFAFVYMLITIVLYTMNKPNLMNQMVSFSFEQSHIQKYLLKDLTIPYIFTDIKGRILWFNDAFMEAFSENVVNKNYVNQIFSELTSNRFPKPGECVTFTMNFKERFYSVEVKRLEGKEIFQQQMEYESEPEALVAIYLYDDTELHRYIRERNDNNLVAGLVYIDNYEETMNSIEDIRRSLLEAMVDRKINKYMQEMNAICKKFERDKFLVLIQQKYVERLKETRFDLLDQIREISVGNTQPVTLSIGLGVRAKDYTESYDYARAAMDLALGRGGDQAVVKDGDKISYYGGKSKAVEKSTRVKARVKAHALREILETKDKVLIMGHSLADADSFGACVGIYRLCKSLNKEAHIILNKLTFSTKPFVDLYVADEAYENDFLVTGEQAEEMIDNNTALVIVDVSNPDLFESRKVYEKADTLVVLDHHRQNQKSLQNAVLSYVEPYASSTCEMVAEILQYVSSKPKLKPLEADTMYAGIILDTDGFASKTGVKTFEAAAYLRRSGADVVRVRKMFRSNASVTKYKAKIIENAEIVEDEFVISTMRGDGVDSPTIIGAQAANDLLDITGIRASFVVTQFKDKVYISARSIDDVNVQLMMERLGGGGHMNMAGAQITEGNLSDTTEMIRDMIREVVKNDEK